MVFGLLLYLGVYSAAGFSLSSTLLVAAHPLSCLWGVGVAAKLLGKGKRALQYPTTLFQVGAGSPLAKVTVDTFLRFLPPKLSRHLGYNRGLPLEVPAGGSGLSTASALPLLGLNLWSIDGFRRDTGLRLHVAALVSLLLSVPGLLLHFLASLPWKSLPEGRVSLAFTRPLIPLALVMEVLFSYAGLSSIRFTLHGRQWLTLVVRLDQLLAVARLAGDSLSDGPCASPRALEEFLRGSEAASRERVRASFFRPLKSTGSSPAPRASAKRRG